MAISVALLRQAALSACVVVTALGLLILTGWIRDWAALKSVFSGSVNMKANSALGFVVSSLVLARLSGSTAPSTRTGLSAVGLLLFLFAALSLSQDLAGWNLGLDEWLFRDASGVGRSLPGRMPPPTAFCFALTGLALFVMAQPIARSWRFPIASGFGVAVIIVALSSLAGHLRNFFQDASVWNFSPMAVDSALAFLFLGGAMLALVHSEGGLPWALDRWTTASFGIGLVLMLSMEVGSYYFTLKLQQQAARVNHTQRVIESTESLVANLGTLSSEQRSYLISGETNWLKSRETIKANVREILGLLLKLTGESPGQQRRLAEIAHYIAERIQMGDNMIEVRRQKGFAAAQHMLTEVQKTPLSDNIGRLLDEIRSEEYGQLEERQKQFSVISIKTFLILPLAGFTSMTLLLLGLFFLNRSVVGRNRINAALASSEAQFKTVFDSLAEGVVVIDRNRNQIAANPAAASHLGLIDPATPYEDAASLLELVMPDGTVLTPTQRPVHRATRGDFVHSYPLIVRRRDTGRAVTAEFRTAPILNEAGEAVQFVISFSDITQRREAEKRAQRLIDFYAAISQTSQASVNAREPAVMYEAVCRICVDYGHASIAFIGLVAGDQVEPVAFAGPAGEHLSAIRISLDPIVPKGNGPIARAVRTGNHYVCNDIFSDPVTLPYREQLRLLGTQATAAFPFRRAGVVFGILSLHVRETDFFSPELIALLEEMASILSFVLDNCDREAARSAAETGMIESEERYRRLVEVSPDAIYVLQGGVITFANEAARRLFGAAVSEDLLGRSASELTHPDFQRSLAGGLRVTALESAASGRVEQVYFQLDGTPIDVEVASVQLDSAEVPSVQVVARDITERKRAAARIEYLATYDGLTDLPNRNLVHDRMTQAIGHAKRSGRQLAVIYFDLDRFKVINDGYGHSFGDAVLKATAQRLQSVVRGEDTVARQSGDEFVILLTEIQKTSDTYIIAQKILDSFERPLLIAAREVYVTASIGVSVYPQNGGDADTLISNADVAMYRAKELGRGVYQFFTQEMSDVSRRHVDLENWLRVAIAQDEMHLAYQPKVDLGSGRIVGCEALLRWNHPALGAVSPVQFIPIAEESSQIVPIGDWVLLTACLQCRAWMDAGLPAVVVAVNLSARQFMQRDVVAWVMATLEETGLPPELLELELTESLIAQDTEKTIATVSELTAKGVHISIDDFGTGYSSLSYLKRFRVDTLKIDQSFIRDMLKDENDSVIPLAVISLGHALKLKVIAEGVESLAQCEFLRRNGCDEIQGYFVSKPVAPEEFARMLTAGNPLQWDGELASRVSLNRDQTE